MNKIAIACLLLLILFLSGCDEGDEIDWKQLICESDKGEWWAFLVCHDKPDSKNSQDDKKCSDRMTLEYDKCVCKDEYPIKNNEGVCVTPGEHSYNGGSVKDCNQISVVSPKDVSACIKLFVNSYDECTKLKGTLIESNCRFTFATSLDQCKDMEYHSSQCISKFAKTKEDCSKITAGNEWYQRECLNRFE